MQMLLSSLCDTKMQTAKHETDGFQASYTVVEDTLIGWRYLKVYVSFACCSFLSEQNNLFKFWYSKLHVHQLMMENKVV